MFCRTCGYALDHLTELRCPEVARSSTPHRARSRISPDLPPTLIPLQTAAKSDRIKCCSGPTDLGDISYLAPTTCYLHDMKPMFWHHHVDFRACEVRG